MEKSDSVNRKTFKQEDQHLHRQRTKIMSNITYFDYENNSYGKNLNFINLQGEKKMLTYERQLGEGTFSKNSVYKDTTTGELFAFKIYKIKNFPKFYMQKEKPIDKVKKECQFWARMVNDHIPRLYYWFEKGDTVIAMSELGDLGEAGTWNENITEYTIKDDVYELFLQKIIREDKQYHGELSPDEKTCCDEDMEHKLCDMNIETKMGKLVPERNIKKMESFGTDGMKMTEEEMAEFGYDDDFYNDLDFDFGMDDTNFSNNDSNVMVSSMLTKKAVLVHQCSSHSNPTKDTVIYKEIGGICDTNKKMYVIGRLFWDVCVGLYYMHKWETAHIDIKPNNIVINKKKNFGKAMIIDFNTVEQYNKDSLFSSSDQEGTEVYSAPEARFNINFKPEQYDMWGLGATLYTFYYGKICADQDFCENDQINFGEAPEPILAIMQGLLEKDTEKRWTWHELWGCELFKLLHLSIDVYVDEKPKKPIFTNKQMWNNTTSSDVCDV